MYRLKQKDVLGPALKRYVVEAPLIARSAQPGQFVIVRNNAYGERIPLTIADSDVEQGTITLVVQEIGASTKQLGEIQVGQGFMDVVGPLGKPSHIVHFGRVVIIGGGVGIAPIHPIAQAMKAAGNEVITILGARNRDYLIMEAELTQASTEVRIVTDDGSYGQAGFVTNVLEQILAEPKPVDLVLAIGPLVMMEAVSRLTQAREPVVPTVVSLNPVMIDGTGMCGACRIQVGTETYFACVDGPEFNGHLVDWELAKRRSQQFSPEEQQALLVYESQGKGAEAGCRCPE